MSGKRRTNENDSKCAWGWHRRHAIAGAAVHRSRPRGLPRPPKNGENTCANARHSAGAASQTRCGYFVTPGFIRVWLRGLANQAASAVRRRLRWVLPWTCSTPRSSRCAGREKCTGCGSGWTCGEAMGWQSAESAHVVAWAQRPPGRYSTAVTAHRPQQEATPRSMCRSSSEVAPASTLARTCFSVTALHMQMYMRTIIENNRSACKRFNKKTF